MYTATKHIFWVYLTRDTLLLLLYLVVFFAPIYVIHNSAPDIYDVAYSLKCYYIHATISNTTCPTFYGLKACRDALTNLNYNTCGNQGAYMITTTDFSTLAFQIPIYLTIILGILTIAAILEWMEYYLPHTFPSWFWDAEPFRKTIIYLHHFIVLPVLLLLMYTVDEVCVSASYAHQLGFNQRPQYGASLYVVVFIVVVILLLDNIKYKYIVPKRK